MKEKFSVLLPVYYGDNAIWVREALASIRSQTMQADETVIVIDGPLPREIDEVIAESDAILGHSTSRVRLAQNRGLGVALQHGLEACRFPIVIRCDSDDINLPDRFAKQIQFLADKPNIAAVGGQITEFASHQLISKRRVPCAATDVRAFSRFRNPVNHMTVAFRKEQVLSCGGYLDSPRYEDYYLWLRMLSAGKSIENLPDLLVYARTPRDFFRRRSGRELFLAELKFQRRLRREGLSSNATFCRNFLLRALPRLWPRPVVQLAYRALLREKPQSAALSRTAGLRE